MLMYDEARDMMSKARNGRKKLANNTYLVRLAPRDVPGRWDTDAPHYAVRLHQTDVVTMHPDGTYTLDSGGWKTTTTKDRINRYAPHSLYAEKQEWWYRANGIRYRFQDGMVVTLTGVVSLRGRIAA